MYEFITMYTTFRVTDVYPSALNPTFDAAVVVYPNGMPSLFYISKN